MMNGSQGFALAVLCLFADFTTQQNLQLELASVVRSVGNIVRRLSVAISYKLPYGLSFWWRIPISFYIIEAGYRDT